VRAKRRHSHRSRLHSCNGADASTGIAVIGSGVRVLVLQYRVRVLVLQYRVRVLVLQDGVRVLVLQYRVRALVLLAFATQFMT
jgi:hypothetical protein